MDRDHPNYGDDLPATCPWCGRAADRAYGWEGVCKCGWEDAEDA